MPDFAVSTSSSCLCHGKSVIQQLLAVWWFSRPFQEFLCLKRMMIQMTVLVLGEKKLAVCFVESGAGRAIQQSWFIQGDMERHVILQSALTLWDLDIRGGGGGGGAGGGEGEKGAGSESVYYEHWHVTCLASGVRICVHCFACWSTPEAISFSQSLHLLLDPGKTGICWSSRGSELSSW